MTELWRNARRDGSQAPRRINATDAGRNLGHPVRSPPATSLEMGPPEGFPFPCNFWNSGQRPIGYCATQASTISETGQGPGSLTISSGASGSSPDVLTAALDFELTFGP